MLGNDVEDEAAPAPAMPKEIVRATTSSKKADVPPASADPARAKKNKKPLTSNEAALKDKTANKTVPAPASTPSKHQKKPFDRHSRTGKTDSKKKIRQGWGSDDKRELDDETAGAADAVAELAEDAAPATPAAKSLQEYLAELQKAEADLAGNQIVRQANDGDEAFGEKLEKASNKEFVSGTSGKKVRQKAPKEKKFLDFNAVFADETPKFSGKKGFQGKKPAKAAKAQDNFPSL